MTTAEKKARMQSLKDAISETHDMQQVGQVWSWEACGVTGTDTCTICGLSHEWGSGGQNTGSFDRYTDNRGNELTLAEAARTECE
jgi:hypothetical protein